MYDELADEHLARLAQMMSEYAAGERNFVSRPYAKFAKRYAPYDHLARVREWSLVAETARRAANERDPRHPGGHPSFAEQGVGSARLRLGVGECRRGQDDVLSHRVVRLLLDGVPPGRILSLTFTKAAAANMANRVFQILGDWVSLDDAELSAAIAKIEGKQPSARRLATARRLFARAIETPGGLKIQTIHAFCERLLHLFPFEANVSARFQVLDDATAAELLAASQKHVLTQAALHPTGAVADALNLVGELAAESTVDTLMKEALKLKGWLREHANGPDGIALAMRRLATELGLAPARRRRISWATSSARAFHAGWRSIAATLRTSKAKTEPGHAESLECGGCSDRRRDALREATSALSSRRVARRERIRLPHQALLRRQPRACRAGCWPSASGSAARQPPQVGARRRAHARAADARRRHRSENEARKSARAALDFDDLIARTRRAPVARRRRPGCSTSSTGGIDHILVDEAQDTSPTQWSIVQRSPRSSSRARARSEPQPHALRGRRREAVDLLVPGRRPGRLRDARRISRRIRPLTAAIGAASCSRRAPHAVVPVGAGRPASRRQGLRGRRHFRGLSFASPVPSGHVGHEHRARGRSRPRRDLGSPVTAGVEPDPDAWARPLDEPDAGAPTVRAGPPDRRLDRALAQARRRGRAAAIAAGRRPDPGAHGAACSSRP